MIQLPEMPARRKARPAYHKPEAVKQLERMMNERYQLDHPSMPPFHHKFRDDTSNALTDCIVKYITLKGGFASRISVQGTYSVKLKRYIPGTARRGLADVSAVYKGKSISIEIKIGKDKQSENQKRVEQEINRAGGIYYIARNFSDFLNWIETI